MKIVLDTNVLISSLLTPSGISFKAVELAFKKHIVILSDYILHEFERRMIEKFQWPKNAIENAVVFFKNRAIILNPGKTNKIIFDDVKDIPILQVIQTSKAHFLVTGDKKLLSVQKFESSFIISPREAVERL